MVNMVKIKINVRMVFRKLKKLQIKQRVTKGGNTNLLHHQQSFLSVCMCVYLIKSSKCPDLLCYYTKLMYCKN